MFLAAIRLVGMDADSRPDMGFLQQNQQRLDVMAIGHGRGYHFDQPVAINHHND